jgi:hypothetical protein
MIVVAGSFLLQGQFWKWIGADAVETVIEEEHTVTGNKTNSWCDAEREPPSPFPKQRGTVPRCLRSYSSSMRVIRMRRAIRSFGNWGGVEAIEMVLEKKETVTHVHSKISSSSRSRSSSSLPAKSFAGHLPHSTEPASD